MHGSSIQHNFQCFDFDKITTKIKQEIYPDPIKLMEILECTLVVGAVVRIESYFKLIGTFC